MSDLSFVAGEFLASLRRRARQQRLFVLLAPRAEPARLPRRCPARACRRRCMASKISSRIRQPRRARAWTSTPTRSKLPSATSSPPKTRTASSSVPSSRATDTVGARVPALAVDRGMRIRDSFLFPHRAMVVSRLITVRVFLVTQTSRRGITGTVGIAAATNPALARVGRRLSPCPMTQSGRSSPWIRSSQGRPVPAPFRNLPSSFPRCLP